MRFYKKNLIFVWYKINNMQSLQFPLSNVQMELLKLYSTNLSEEDLQELKSLLSNFYAKKSIEEANQIWDKKGFSDDLMDEWLKEDS